MFDTMKTVLTVAIGTQIFI